MVSQTIGRAGENGVDAFSRELGDVVGLVNDIEIVSCASLQMIGARTAIERVRCFIPDKGVVESVAGQGDRCETRRDQSFEMVAENIARCAADGVDPAPATSTILSASSTM